MSRHDKRYRSEAMSPIAFNLPKGTFQKRFSGFCPLRGGGGYPPFPLRVFGQNGFPLGGGGTPQFG